MKKEYDIEKVIELRDSYAQLKDIPLKIRILLRPTLTP